MFSFSLSVNRLSNFSCMYLVVGLQSIQTVCDNYFPEVFFSFTLLNNWTTTLQDLWAIAHLWAYWYRFYVSTLPWLLRSPSPSPSNLHWQAEWVPNPICPSNSLSPLTQCTETVRVNGPLHKQYLASTKQFYLHHSSNEHRQHRHGEPEDVEQWEWDERFLCVQDVVRWRQHVNSERRQGNLVNKYSRIVKFYNHHVDKLQVYISLISTLNVL